MTTIENGMVRGAEAELDRKDAEQAAREVRVMDALMGIRTDKLMRREALKEMLDAIECAPPNLANYLKDCVMEDDMLDFLATIRDMVEYQWDRMAEEEVDGRR